MQSATAILTGNLPAEPNSFIGRERDLAELARLLGEVRALTLSGPGFPLTGMPAQSAVVAQETAHTLGCSPGGSLSAGAHSLPAVKQERSLAQGKL